MIKLTELRFNKETLSFEKVPVMVNEDFISNFGPNKITMSAPTIVACKIFGDDRVPDEYYKEIASTECTTIILKDRTEIDVAETLKQIEDIIK